METPENNKTIPPQFIDELRKIGFSPAEEKRLRQLLSWREFKKGYIIDVKQEVVNNRFYILKGVARSFYIKNGKEYNCSFSFDGQFIILPLSMLMNGQDIYIQFLDKTETCCIPLHSNITPKDMQKDFPILESVKFWQFINMAMVHHLKELEEQLFMLRMDAKDRYNWALSHYPGILEKVSITQLASFLDVTKETLYRIRSGKY